MHQHFHLLSNDPLWFLAFTEDKKEYFQKLSITTRKTISFIFLISRYIFNVQGAVLLNDLKDDFKGVSLYYKASGFCSNMMSFSELNNEYL